MAFVDGELYERSIATPFGVVDVLAEIAVVGRQLELREIAVYPRSADQLTVSPAELLSWARLALVEIRAADFTSLRVTGTRLSGARRGRRIDLVIRLERKQS